MDTFTSAEVRPSRATPDAAPLSSDAEYVIRRRRYRPWYKKLWRAAGPPRLLSARYQVLLLVLLVLAALAGLFIAPGLQSTPLLAP